MSSHPWWRMAPRGFSPRCSGKCPASRQRKWTGSGHPAWARHTSSVFLVPKHFACRMILQLWSWPLGYHGHSWRPVLMLMLSSSVGKRTNSVKISQNEHGMNSSSRSWDLHGAIDLWHDLCFEWSRHHGPPGWGWSSTINPRAGCPSLLWNWWFLVFKKGIRLKSNDIRPIFTYQIQSISLNGAWACS